MVDAAKPAHHDVRGGAAQRAEQRDRHVDWIERGRRTAKKARSCDEKDACEARRDEHDRSGGHPLAKNPCCEDGGEDRVRVLDDGRVSERQMDEREVEAGEGE
jgi:hypothetical protein